MKAKITLALAASAAIATAAFALSPLAASAQAIQSPILSSQQRTLIQTEIALLLLEVQQLEQQLAALQSQSIPVVSVSPTATTTPGTAPVSASTTPSSAVVKPIISVSVNGTSFSKGQPMTVTWSANVAFGTDPTRLPYLELFPDGANPIIVPSVRVARPAINAASYVWFVSPNGILGDTLAPGKYLVQIGLYDPPLQTYIIGAYPTPVTFNL